MAVRCRTAGVWPVSLSISPVRRPVRGSSAGGLWVVSPRVCGAWAAVAPAASPRVHSRLRVCALEFCSVTTATMRRLSTSSGSYNSQHEQAAAAAAPRNAAVAVSQVPVSSVAPATVDNTYILGILPEDLKGEPEMVRRVFTLLNGRRSDLAQAQRQRALQTHRRFIDDTGSPEVQAAILSARIRSMSAHLTANRKDNNCKRILTRVLHRRRKVLQYLFRLSPRRYHQVSAFACTHRHYICLFTTNLPDDCTRASMALRVF
eukprot:COSAG01_NODE_296_length_19281_cov_212.029507_4_plen_261_part_00